MKLKHIFAVTMFLFVGMLCVSSINALSINDSIPSEINTYLFDFDYFDCADDDNCSIEIDGQTFFKTYNSNGTTQDPDSFTNPQNAFDNDNATYATKTTAGSYSLGKTFPSKRLSSVRVVCSALVQNAGSGNVETVTATLQKYNGSSWSNVQVLFDTSASTSTVSASYSGTIDITDEPEIQGLRVVISATSGGVQQYVRINTLEYATSEYNFSTSGNKTYTIYAANSTDTINETGIFLVNPYQHFRFYDTLRSVYLTDFYINDVLQSGSYYTNTTYGLGLGNISLDFSKFGYENETFYQLINITSNLNVTFNPTPVTITIKVYDGDDPTTQLTFDLLMINSTTALNYTGELNFSAYCNETVTGDIEIRLSSAGYSDAKYYATFGPFTAVSVNTYLFNENDTSIHTFTVQELDTGNNVNDVLVEVQQIIGSSYTTLSQGETSNGQVYFYLDPTQEYKVIFTKDGYVSATAFTIPGTTTYTVKLTETSTSYDYVEDLSYKFTPAENTLYENETYNFTGFISSDSITITYFTLTLDNGTVLYTTSSVNPSGTSFVYEYTIGSNVSSVIANMTYVKDGVTNTLIKTWDVISYSESWMKSMFEYSKDTDDEDVMFRWLIIMIVTVLILIGGALAGMEGVSLLIIPEFAMFAFLGWMSWTYAGVVIFIGLVFFIGGRK